MKYDRKIVVDNILKIMEDKRITQNDLANIANTHQSRISRCLKCEGDFTISQLADIASYFDVSIDTLLSGEKEDCRQEITAKDVCKLLHTLSNFPGATFIDIDNAVPKYEFRNDTSLFYRESYKALYFNNLLLDDPLFFCCKTWNVHINSFVDKMAHLAELKNKNELSREDYDYLVNKHLEDFNNEYVSKDIVYRESISFTEDE